MKDCSVVLGGVKDFLTGCDCQEILRCCSAVVRQPFGLSEPYRREKLIKQIFSMRNWKVLLSVAGLLGVSACMEQRESLLGQWVQPVPGMPRMEQGFVLKANGKASSVNMATLLYQAWEQRGDRLILSGISVGNGQTMAFSDTLVIEKLTRDSLVLRQGMGRQAYVRSESGVKHGVLPAANRLPDTDGRKVRGTLTISHEVRSLRLEGDTSEYWVVDKTGKLLQMYDSVTGGIKNGMPVDVELQVVDMEGPEPAFARDYDGVLGVLGIDRFAPADR